MEIFKREVSAWRVVAGAVGALSLLAVVGGLGAYLIPSREVPKIELPPIVHEPKEYEVNRKHAETLVERLTQEGTGSVKQWATFIRDCDYNLACILNIDKENENILDGKLGMQELPTYLRSIIPLERAVINAQQRPGLFRSKHDVTGYSVYGRPYVYGDKIVTPYFDFFGGRLEGDSRSQGGTIKIARYVHGRLITYVTLTYDRLGVRINAIDIKSPPYPLKGRNVQEHVLFTDPANLEIATRYVNDKVFNILREASRALDDHFNKREK